MESSAPSRRPAIRSCSQGNKITRSHTFCNATPTNDKITSRSPAFCTETPTNDKVTRSPAFCTVTPTNDKVTSRSPAFCIATSTNDKVTRSPAFCTETPTNDKVTSRSPAFCIATSTNDKVTRSPAFCTVTPTNDKVTRSPAFCTETLTNDPTREEKESLRQRRKTVASYMPQSKKQDGNSAETVRQSVGLRQVLQDGNSAETDLDKQQAKSLRDFSTDEVGKWFTIIGLQKCLPFIKAAGLCGADIASVGVDTLQLLHISTLEDRERLLSAIYRELHPHSASSQGLDSLLETVGPNNVERFTAALESMSKSKSSPHVGCLYTNRGSMKLRSPGAVMQRNAQLMEITINASEQIVHLRAPKETTVGKVMESCVRMLGLAEDKHLFTLKYTPGSAEELSSDVQIGGLATWENRQLELHLCKKGKVKVKEIQDLRTEGSHENSSHENSSHENGPVNQPLQGSQPGKGEKIKELNQQVDSLQNVILQVQELHHGLVAFCSELKSLEGEADVARLSPAELQARLEVARDRLGVKRRSLQMLRDAAASNATSQRSKQSEVHLLEKMTLNCQVFKEEISLVHLNRQVAHLQTALQGCQDKAQRRGSSLGKLVRPQGPAMLLVVVQEDQGSDGRYGFTCRLSQDRGLEVVHTQHSHLCLHDRLVEVDGVSVVGYSEEELNALLLQKTSVQIVALRRPPHDTPSQQEQHPSPGYHDNADPPLSASPERDAVSTATPQLCELIAI